MKKRGSFEYDQPWELWRMMFPQYESRAAALLRRPETLSLGYYTLGEFRRFYTALMTVCAVHEYLCYRWKLLRGTFPYESAVMVRRASSWSNIFAHLSGIADDKCRVMMNELTFTGARWSDLHIYPFVALDLHNQELALADPFPLHSNIDENILRVCSTIKRAIFDAASLSKEGVMREEIAKRCPQYASSGPLALTKPTPDIDMVMTDESHSTIVILELKWIRKPFGQFERMKRDEDTVKGFSQLKKIGQFLIKNPSYLSSHRNLPRSLDAYDNVHYLVVARDHWPWAEPDNDIAIVDFAAFSSIVGRSVNLHEALTELIKYDWLPIEGRDFTVVFETQTVGSVQVEAETFYAC